MDNTGCAYCFEGEALDKFGIKICELPASKLYLFKEQSHKGRVIVAHKKHVSELVDLTDEERDAYFADIAHVARALHRAFHPDKINYGAYGLTPAAICTSISCPSIRMALSGAACLR